MSATADPRRWLVLGIASLAIFMFFLDATIVNIAFPALQAAFPTSTAAALSWVLTGYTIVFAAFLVAAGRMADLIGRRRVFMSGVAIFTVASALCGLAPTLGLLIAGRVLQALGGAMVVPSALGLVLPEFDAKERGTAVGLWSAVAAVAAAIGPTLGSGIIELGSWRWIFLANLPVGAASLVLGARVLRESRDPSARRPDAAGVAGLGVGMAALALAIVQGGEWGWGDPRTLIAFGVAVASIPAVLTRSARHPSPVLDLALFRTPSFTVANVASLLFAIGFFAGMLNGVLFLTGVWGYSMLAAGLAITPGPVTAAIAAAIGGTIADRRGYRVVVVPGCLMAAASMALLLLRAGPEAAYLTVWLPSAILLGAGIGLGFATLGGAAVASLPAARFAVGSAVLSTARQFGGVIGVAALIAVLGTPGPEEAMAAFDRAFILIGSSLLASAIVAMALERGPARSPAEQPEPAPVAL